MPIKLKSQLFNLLEAFPKNWLHKYFLWENLTNASKYASGRLLDVGCAEKPYEKLFKPLVTEYIGIDHLATYHPRTKIDVFSSAMRLPFKDNSFDTVLATQVIEHLPQPALFFQEASRVLKPGGHLIVTAPHIWMVHEPPFDFFRYTKYGLRRLSRRSGLTPVVIEPMGGFWATFAIRLSYYCHDLLRGGFFTEFLGRQLCRLLQLVGWELDKLHPVYTDTHNYLLVAGKEL